MSEINREEIDAKLTANEARNGAQYAVINGKLDVIVERLDNQSKRIDRLDRSVEAATGALSSLRGTIVLTGLTSVVAIILGVAGFNAALLSNMTAMFESGKVNAEMQYETRRQVEETAALLKSMQEKYDKPAAHD
jgi:hypothetical protein